MRKLLVLLTAIFVCALPAIAQDKRGPSTPEERTKALAVIDDLETNPLGPNAKDERSWLTIWLIQVPDIHVGFCIGLLPDLPKGNKQDSNVLATQTMYSSARYAIQHDGGSSTSVEQYEAGVVGALKTYEALVAQNPKDRQAKMDEVLARRDAGTLSAYVKERAAKSCKAS